MMKKLKLLCLLLPLLLLLVACSGRPKDGTYINKDSGMSLQISGDEVTLKTGFLLNLTGEVTDKTFELEASFFGASASHSYTYKVKGKNLEVTEPDSGEVLVFVRED